MYKLLVLALCVAAAAATALQPRGVVDPVELCGGMGIALELRVSECEGRCQLEPGKLYTVEGDIVAYSDAPSLNLLVDVIFEGVDRPIMDVVLENSAVEAGNAYTVRYTLSPSAQFSGNAVFLRFTLYHTNEPEVVEVCVSAEVDIL